MMRRYSIGLFLLLALMAACSGAPNDPAAATEPDPSLPPPATAVPPTATSTPTEPDLANGLVAHYPFSGNGEDASGNGIHAEVFGAMLTADRHGQPDSAFRFDGRDDYIVAPDADPLDLSFQASLSVWLLYEPQPTADFYTLLEKSDPERDGHSRYGLWLIEDRVEFCVEPASNDFQRCLDGERPLTPGIWHHLAGTYDGDILRVYVDGRPAGEKSFPRSGISQNAFELFIGTDLYQANTRYTSGVIDEIRIYERPLTPDEVTLLSEE